MSWIEEAAKELNKAMSASDIRGGVKIIRQVGETIKVESWEESLQHVEITPKYLEEFREFYSWTMKKKGKRMVSNLRRGRVRVRKFAIKLSLKKKANELNEPDTWDEYDSQREWEARENFDGNRGNH